MTELDRPYVNRRNKYIGQRIDVDDYPVGHEYQCVDLFKNYMTECLGETIGKTGNANEIRDNTYGVFGKSRKRRSDTQNLMQGDILVRTRGTYGHITIFDRYVDGKIFVIEQNGSGQNSGDGLGDNAIRIRPYSPSFWSGIRRSTKIIENYNKEIKFIKNKIKTQGADQDTLEYLASIRVK